MKRTLAILLVVFLILGLTAYLIYANAATVLAHVISHKTETPVSVERVDFKRQAFTVSELTVDNPKGAKEKTALTVQTLNVEAPYIRYFENPIVIEEISLNDVYVNIQLYNKDQTEGNWQTILKSMEEDHSSPLSNERVTIIKKLVLTDIKIKLILDDGSVHNLSPIARLQFDNIHSDKGIPTQEISEIIIKQMMQSIFLEKGLKVIIEAPFNVIKGVFPFL